MNCCRINNFNILLNENKLFSSLCTHVLEGGLFARHLYHLLRGAEEPQAFFLMLFDDTTRCILPFWPSIAGVPIVTLINLYTLALPTIKVTKLVLFIVAISRPKSQLYVIQVRADFFHIMHAHVTRSHVDHIVA